MDTDNDPPRLLSSSTNRTITISSRKKAKKNRIDSSGKLKSRIETVYENICGGDKDKVTGERASPNECHSYSNHVVSHNHHHLPANQDISHNHHHHQLSSNSHLHDIYMNHPKQVQLINLLYLNYENILIDKAAKLSSTALTTKYDPILSTLLDDVKAKIQGYKRQDIKKFCVPSPTSMSVKYTSAIINENIITPHDTVEMLVSSRLKCLYCKESCFLIYKTQYEKKQWTLDRINNGDCHTFGNVVVSCLECNIKRGTMNKERFEKGKQIKVVRKLQ
tara:strand:+ start:407 stop:1237 length:831 start_codon:yes stop_codon:yes gene_type:complete